MASPSRLVNNCDWSLMFLVAQNHNAHGNSMVVMFQNCLVKTSLLSLEHSLSDLLNVNTLVLTLLLVLPVIRLLLVISWLMFFQFHQHQKAHWPLQTSSRTLSHSNGTNQLIVVVLKSLTTSLKNVKLQEDHGLRSLCLLPEPSWSSKVSFQMNNTCSALLLKTLWVLVHSWIQRCQLFHVIQSVHQPDQKKSNMKMS